MGKRRYSNLTYRKNRKGVVFTLDAAVAVMLVVAIIVVSSYYAILSAEEPLAELQMTRIGYDILAVLDYNKILDTMNKNLIRTELESMLPTNYEMRLAVTTKNSASGIVVETSEKPPGKRFVATGQRTFVTDNDFGTAKFWIWTR